MSGHVAGNDVDFGLETLGFDVFCIGIFIAV